MALLERAAALGQYAHFAARVALLLVGTLARPAELARSLHMVLLGSLPLTIVAGLSMGVVIWLHLHGVLQRFGPGNVSLLPQAMALAVVMELGPLGAGFLVAGRSGAGLGAELGSMRLSEQLDALEVLGLSPVRQLVAPRVMACILALPLLTVTMDFASLAGGYIAEAIGGTMTLQAFATECGRELRLRDVLPATAKTMVFGFLIGVTGCYEGMRAHGGTEAVGEAATRGVVRSFFLVAIANVFLVRILH